MNWIFYIVCCNVFDAVATGDWNFAGLNIAKDKYTSQSPGTYQHYTSDLAVDGDTNTTFVAESCSHTGLDQPNTKATWKVCLNNSYTIKGIRIFSRFGHRYRHENFTIKGEPSSILLHDDKTASPKLYNNEQIDVVVDSVHNFSSITVEVPAHIGQPDDSFSIIQLCEVQIFSENNDCHMPMSANGLQVTVRQGTGFLNTSKQLVSTNTVLEFRCDEYHTFQGSTEATCMQGGHYNTNIPTCDAIANKVAEKSTLVAAAAGGGTAAVVTIFAVVAIVVFIVLRRRRARTHFPDTISTAETPPAVAVYSNEIYEESDLSENCNEKTVVSDYRTPCHDLNDLNKIPKSGINIKKLADEVLSPDASSDRFQNEFMDFPSGMVREHQHALQNIPKNRYKGLYAYDDTRVILEKWNEEKDTDYINACYIHGFENTRAYIASQGPVKDNIEDFWRMLWQNNCTRIVMLTNLCEDGKIKCKRYWPESGTETFNGIDVTLENEDVFSNFIIRSLNIRKGECNRRLLHFQFTSWPDKDVPHVCSALIHFRSKVKAAKTSCRRPILVHCSAGIGRTGTFIAIDYLVDQAMRLGYVDVSGCVESLRRQRVNMVQTKKQYIFVHLALVEILVMRTSVVPSAQFEKMYGDLLLMDDDKKKRNIDVEFEILKKMLPLDDDNETNKAKAQGSKTKNRYSNRLPFKDFMPSLSQPGLYMFGEYINASFLPMHRVANAMIITQSPLENTISDFWNMVLHQDVHTIIMVNHTSELCEREEYWPAPGEGSTYDGIKIMRNGNQNVEKRSGHSIIRLSITTESEQREVMLIQFEKWDKGSRLPEQPTQILSALELMEENQRNTGNKQVIVHCMDGVEKSGLFCVVAAVLDRLKVEQEVAISQVIQEMRNRRQNIIPNVEQFEFCHEVVRAFLEQYETYSNFAFQT